MDVVRAFGKWWTRQPPIRRHVIGLALLTTVIVPTVLILAVAEGIVSGALAFRDALANDWRNTIVAGWRNVREGKFE
jgi:hypothetical protein